MKEAGIIGIILTIIGVALLIIWHPASIVWGIILIILGLALIIWQNLEHEIEQRKDIKTKTIKK